MKKYLVIFLIISSFMLFTAPPDADATGFFQGLFRRLFGTGSPNPSDTPNVAVTSDVTAPTVSTATIASNGTTLTLAMSETVTRTGGTFDVDCSTAGANITATYSSGSGSNSLVYTLGTTVNTGDTCNLDYDGAANGIEDGAGNDLAAITDKAVTNNSMQGTNNVALVAGHLGGDTGTWPRTSTLGGNNVTSGNTVLCGVGIYGNGHTFSAAGLTKTAGSSTIGTITLDQSANGGTADVGVAIYRIPITGGGTLTLSFDGEGDIDIDFVIIGCAEFSGVHATPLSTTSTTTGTGTSHSTGSVATTDVGVMMYVATEIIGSDMTRTYSDQLIHKTDTASSTFTGIIQYKIINSSPNTLTDTTGSQSGLWKVAYALYKTN